MNRMNRMNRRMNRMPWALEHQNVAWRGIIALGTVDEATASNNSAWVVRTDRWRQYIATINGGIPMADDCEAPMKTIRTQGARDTVFDAMVSLNAITVREQDRIRRRIAFQQYRRSWREAARQR